MHESESDSEPIIRSSFSRRKSTKYKFRGLMAPVFTCFKNDDECSLDLSNVDNYARWLKTNDITGVLVNGITGEGPALAHLERRRNAEAWTAAARKHQLVIFLQVGGAALPDVLDLARQAYDLQVDGVFCLPESFYKPSNIEHLVGFCRIVAKKCRTLPFFYVHSPFNTGVNIDLLEFIEAATEAIPNFAGLQFNDLNLDAGGKCLNRGLVIFLGQGRLLASGMLMGFNACLMSVLNIRPDLGYDIYNAMKDNDLSTVKRKQKQLNNLIQHYTGLKSNEYLHYVPAVKSWFNDAMLRVGGAGFSAGPSRKFF